MKAAPVVSALRGRGVRTTLVHTGQHYDDSLSGVFFRELGLPQPDVNLEVGSASHAQQTAQVMMRFEPVLLETRPDWVVVYGDVNSSLACALVASKLGVRLAHVEAGLRSRDWSMPEEVNRVVVDRISDLLLTPSQDADANLLAEGVPAERIHFVGNCMIDTLLRLLPSARPPRQGRLDRDFLLVTLHRPSNVDELAMLRRIVESLNALSAVHSVVFPVHPRTRRKLQESQLKLSPDVELLDPLPYLEFLWLQSHAKAVVTDSGGVQEETTILGVPCFTLRTTTERPVTCELGTNTLLGAEPERLGSALSALMDGQHRAARVPPLWDGRAGERVADSLIGQVAAAEG